MRIYFFIFLFLIFSLFLVNASLNIDKGKIYLDMNVSQKTCQTITITSDDYKGTIKIRDIWAEDFSEGGNLNKYTLNSEDLGITIFYNKIIENFSKNAQLELCLSSNEPGNFKGALIFTPESKDNIVLEIGSWLYINVNGDGEKFKEIIKLPTGAVTSPTILEEVNIERNEKEDDYFLLLLKLIAGLILSGLFLTVLYLFFKY